MDTEDLIEALGSGVYDDDLEQIAEAVQKAIQLRAVVTVHRLTTGDRIVVQLPPGIRPRYLDGATGEFIRKLDKNVAVRFDTDINDPYGKWAGKECRLDASWVRPLVPVS